jgi:hypothetical protein
MSEFEASSDRFLDGPDHEALFKRICESDTKEDFITCINVALRNWIVTATDEYSSDYSYLARNWVTVCKKFGKDHNIKISPQQIVLVADIRFDDDHKLLRAVSEYMTMRGYCVRKYGEFIECKTCGKVLPSKPVWEHMKKSGMDVPDRWSDRCSGC